MLVAVGWSVLLAVFDRAGEVNPLAEKGSSVVVIWGHSALHHRPKLSSSRKEAVIVNLGDIIKTVAVWKLEEFHRKAGTIRKHSPVTHLENPSCPCHGGLPVNLLEKCERRCKPGWCGVHYIVVIDSVPAGHENRNDLAVGVWATYPSLPTLFLFDSSLGQIHYLVLRL
jgi:hypothetical protein